MARRRRRRSFDMAILSLFGSSRSWLGLARVICALHHRPKQKMRVLLWTAATIAAAFRPYPIFEQCDPRWGNDTSE